ncbi:MAG: mechanosensitive ion channel [Flavobacteriales bacterium]|nr:mechanosensitive ion channel [Flavobacteriales bacterium]
MMKFLRQWLIDKFLGFGVNEFYSEFITVAILLIGVLITGIIVDKIAREILLSTFIRIAKKSKTKLDDILVEKKVFAAIAHLAPVIFIFYFIPGIFDHHEVIIDYSSRLSGVIIIIATMVIIFRVLDSLRTVLEFIPSFKDKPLRSYFQLAKIVIGIILGILILSIIANKSIIYFFSAFGAMTAVVLLVFKDTLLGFIASIQLSANDMIRVGDWVQMDKYGADGDVIEINLTTVKVRNWDKTISTVPTYSFISDSFKNWRGMEETGARRIARSVYINQNSVRFCTDEMINRFKKIHILKHYVEERQAEIKIYNEVNKINTEEVSNGRRMTNLGTFRAYLLEYIKRHPKINKDLTILVRQLAPTEKGIPIQIYAFCSDIAWVNYEAVQSDIFDHTLAVISQFDLEVFQSPSGGDFKQLLK